MHSMKTELSQEYTPAAEPHIGTVPIEQKANGRGETSFQPPVQSVREIR